MGICVTSLLGPAATILAAVAAVTVTAIFAKKQTDIAREQARTAKEKLRHDLFERRWLVFVTALDLYYAMISWADVPTHEQAKAKDAFFRAYQQSGFLFSKESGVEDLMKNLNDMANTVTGLKESLRNAGLDVATRLSWQTEIHNIQTRRFEESFLRLKSAISPYLNFHEL